MKHILAHNPATQHSRPEPHRKLICANGRSPSCFTASLKPLPLTIEKCHVYLQPQPLEPPNPGNTMEILTSINRPLNIWEKYVLGLMHGIKSQDTSMKVKPYWVPSLQERERRTRTHPPFILEAIIFSLFINILRGPTAYSSSLPEVSFP